MTASGVGCSLDQILSPWTPSSARNLSDTCCWASRTPFLKKARRQSPLGLRHDRDNRIAHQPHPVFGGNLSIWTSRLLILPRQSQRQLQSCKDGCVTWLQQPRHLGRNVHYPDATAPCMEKNGIVNVRRMNVKKEHDIPLRCELPQGFCKILQVNPTTCA